MAAPGLRPTDWELGTYNARLVDPHLLPPGTWPHTVEPIPFLAPQISSQAELTYSDISREVEVAFAQEDFTDGLATMSRFSGERSKQFRWCKNLDTSWPEYILPAPKVFTIGATIGSEPTMALQRGVITYLAAGANLYQITDSATMALDTTFASTITSLYVAQGYLIVGLGDSTNFRYRSGNVSGAAFTDGGFPGRYFISETYKIIRAVRPNTIYIADQITGPWADYIVGDQAFNITSLALLETWKRLQGIDANTLVVGKEDGPYAFDESFESIPLIPEIALNYDANVCAAALVFNRDYYCTTRKGFVKLSPGESLTNIGLERLVDPALPSGESAIKSVTTDGRFLYANVVSGSGVYIWKLNIKGAWHNYLWREDLGQGAALLFDTPKLGSTAINAIMFGYKVGGNWQVAYANYAYTSNPLRDSGYQFDDAHGGSLRTLDYVGNLPTVEKYTERIKVVGDNLAATRYVAIVTYPDAGSSNSVTKAFGTYTTSPHQERQVDPVRYHRVALDLAITSQNATTVPQVRAFHASATYITRVVRKHTCQFLAASFLPLRTGGRQRNHIAEVLDKFRELRKDQSLLSCKDEDGRTFDAQIEDIWERPLMVRAGGPDSQPIKVVTCVLKEVVPA